MRAFRSRYQNLHRDRRPRDSTLLAHGNSAQRRLSACHWRSRFKGDRRTAGFHCPLDHGATSIACVQCESVSFYCKAVLSVLSFVKFRADARSAYVLFDETGRDFRGNPLIHSLPTRNRLRQRQVLAANLVSSFLRASLAAIFASPNTIPEFVITASSHCGIVPFFLRSA